LPDRRDGAAPDREFQKRETAAIVWRALDALPFDQRAVIVLREIEGLSYEEIATSLDVAVGTVKSRLARARESLREGLGAR
jgi:RNA polymerase sigma-70 factor (ECF subfamily)